MFTTSSDALDGIWLRCLRLCHYTLQQVGKTVLNPSASCVLKRDVLDELMRLCDLAAIKKIKYKIV